ncbi:MAG: bifunctional 4-hydroxy-2-oxoglutarate aldolase/2-dehydro-3-deoxy-phosphogluconate aldolase [Candidatus Limnocylindrus sp.]|jgi:2-dehydro-3-deoxyphosphogluconate aldolase/(4S)-4-hydroxy-2-oxoglutarate aldolase
MTTAPRTPDPLAVLAKTRLLPAVSPLDGGVVDAWADACMEHGVPALELLLRGDGSERAAYDTIARLSRSHPQLAVGVGTVFDATTAQRACDAGARIVVSPITDPATGGTCAAAGVDWLPGAFTPTEIALAERSGASQVKLFPAMAIDAPAFLRSYLATKPSSRIIPTNISLEEIPALVAAGAAGFGVGERLLAGADPRSARAIGERLHAALSAAGGGAY